MTKDELISKIDKLKKSIASPLTNESFKPSMKTQLEKFENELKEIDKKPATSDKKSTGKIKMKNIFIHWAEGKTSLTDKIKGKTFTSWKDATVAMRPFMPLPDEGYNKVKFKITFEDGEEYEGRLDLSHTEDNALTTSNIFGDHILQFLNYELSEKSQSSEKSKKEIKEWLEKYDIGQTNTKVDNKNIVPKKTAVKKSVTPPKKKKVEPKVAKPTSDKKSKSTKVDLHPDCNELLEDYMNRKKSQEKSKKKHKKDSISDLIGWRLAGVAKKTITNISDADLKKSPQKYIKQFKAIQKETKIFIGKLKPLLGSDFNKKSLSQPMDKVIEKFINQVKKK